MSFKCSQASQCSLSLRHFQIQLEKNQGSQPARGYTLVELLIILSITGTLAAIAAPGMLGMWQRQKLNAAQDEVYQVLIQTQDQAKQQHLSWQASLRTGPNEVVEWAQHRSDRPPNYWKKLDSSIRIDEETSLPQANGIYQVQFDDRGRVDSRLGRITLASKSDGTTKRCVIISTLLGKLRTSTEQPQKRDNKFCY